MVHSPCLVMGILNITPDSFSDGGKWNTRDKALAHARDMVAQGAQIIDVGGESTRPGATRVTAEEEAARVVPIVSALHQELSLIHISEPTRRHHVSRMPSSA